MTMGLTRHALTCLILIDHRLTQTGVAPNYKEIAQALGFKSNSCVGRILDQLEARGYIERIPWRSRAIRLCGPRSIRCECDRCEAKIYGNEIALVHALDAPMPDTLRSVTMSGIKQHSFPQFRPDRPSPDSAVADKRVLPVGGGTNLSGASA